MKPLANVRVVEVGSVVLGPYAGLLLAELGATVTKIEPLAGDPTRSLGHLEHPGMGAIFMNCNRGKQSLAVDMRRPEGRELVERLVAESDVFFHNMRLDSAERLGIGYAALSTIRPELVYCAAYGYGAAGRGARLPAYDDIIQAGSGIADFRGRIDGTPAYAPTIMADKTTALFVVIGILGALMERARTGLGRQIEVPMLETMTHFVAIEHLNGLTWEQPKASSGYTRLLNPHRRPYRTRDGWLAVMPYNSAQWDQFFTAAGRQDIVTDPRFADAESRARHIFALYEAVAETMPSRTSAEWIEILKKQDIPYGPVNSLEDLVTDPHMNDVGFWHLAEHPTEGMLRIPSFPVRDGGPQGSATPVANAPALGEHTRVVMRDLGYAEEAIDALAGAGVVIAP